MVLEMSPARWQLFFNTIDGVATAW